MWMRLFMLDGYDIFNELVFKQIGMPILIPNV